MSKPLVIVLVGVPGSGKSTWYEKHRSVVDANAVYISSDKYIEDAARAKGMTYSEAFKELAPAAMQHVKQQVQEAKRHNKDIVWDQTNVSVKSRKKIMQALPRYYKIAVVFPIPEPEELKRRLSNRPGKEIPEPVIQSMIANFQEPTRAEGFDDVRYAT